MRSNWPFLVYDLTGVIYSSVAGGGAYLWGPPVVDIEEMDTTVEPVRSVRPVHVFY